MGYRNLLISTPCRISVKYDQLIILSDKEHRVPIEDISSIVIETLQCTVTAAALSLLGQAGCAVIFCDSSHMPCSVMYSFSQHSRGYGALKLQLNIGQVLKKRLWQQVVVAKIQNQAQCLSYCGLCEDATSLAMIAKRVKSDDAGNLEALAAKKYFPALFGTDFTRDMENKINAALNYGYAIIRGVTARCLAVYGFIPALGIHHRNELNSFNLADDLMEPFRPVVDLLVWTLIDGDDELNPQDKHLLLNVLNLDIILNGKRYTVAYAIELYVQSLIRSLKENKASLTTPQLCQVNIHQYE